MSKIDPFTREDRNGSEIGIVAMSAGSGRIEIMTDSGDAAVTSLTAADARALAAWLTAAADACDQKLAAEASVA